MAGDDGRELRSLRRSQPADGRLRTGGAATPPSGEWRGGGSRPSALGPPSRTPPLLSLPAPPVTCKPEEGAPPPSAGARQAHSRGRGVRGPAGFCSALGGAEPERCGEGPRGRVKPPCGGCGLPHSPGLFFARPPGRSTTCRQKRPDPSLLHVGMGTGLRVSPFPSVFSRPARPLCQPPLRRLFPEAPLQRACTTTPISPVGKAGLRAFPPPPKFFLRTEALKPLKPKDQECCGNSWARFSVEGGNS